MSMQQCYKEIRGAVGYYIKQATDVAMLKERIRHKTYLKKLKKIIDKFEKKDCSRKDYNDYFIHEAGESVFDRTASTTEMSYFYLGKQEAYKQIKQLLGPDES